MLGYSWFPFTIDYAHEIVSEKGELGPIIHNSERMIEMILARPTHLGHTSFLLVN